MAFIHGLLAWCILMICTRAQVYNGCEHYAVDSIFVPCNKGGIVRKPAQIKQFTAAKQGNILPYLVCATACFDNINCRSYSFRAADKLCKFYSKPFPEMDFVAGETGTSFFAAGCLAGKDIAFPQRVYAQDRFDPGSTFTINNKGNPQAPNWDIGRPDRCKSGEALHALPPLEKVISMKRKLPLNTIGATYTMRFDYMYQSADPNNIIFGLLFQDDALGGLDHLWELARASDPSMQGIWQTKEVTFTTFRTKLYSIQLDLGVQPGANATKRTQWRIDNFAVFASS